MCRLIASLCCVAIISVLGCTGGVYAQTAAIALTRPGINTVDGVYGNPYHAIENGVPDTLVICEDYLDDSYQFSHLGLTRHPTKRGPAPRRAREYEEAAYLSTELLTAFRSYDPIAAGEISIAVWGVFDPGAWTHTYTAGQYSDLLIYSPNTSHPITSGGGDTCRRKAPPHESRVVHTPEPPVPLVLAFDLLAVVAGAFLWRRYLVRPASN